MASRFTLSAERIFMAAGKIITFSKRIYSGWQKEGKFPSGQDCNFPNNDCWRCAKCLDAACQAGRLFADFGGLISRNLTVTASGITLTTGCHTNGFGEGFEWISGTLNGTYCLDLLPYSLTVSPSINCIWSVTIPNVVVARYRQSGFVCPTASDEIITDIKITFSITNGGGHRVDILLVRPVGGSLDVATGFSSTNPACFTFPMTKSQIVTNIILSGGSFTISEGC